MIPDELPIPIFSLVGHLFGEGNRSNSTGLAADDLALWPGTLCDGVVKQYHGNLGRLAGASICCNNGIRVVFDDTKDFFLVFVYWQALCKLSGLGCLEGFRIFLIPPVKFHQSCFSDLSVSGTWFGEIISLGHLDLVFTAFCHGKATSKPQVSQSSSHTNKQIILYTKPKLLQNSRLASVN
ncbi:hypothetical protein AWENTII_002536 [Aspergillus wentii]